MKTSIISLFTMISLFMFACEGPTGPEGPAGLPGEDGLDGVGIPGRVFEIIGDFTPDNDYTISFGGFNVEAESDVILIYRLWEIGVDSEGEFDIWRALPQTLFFEEGAFQYNFDHTYFDANIFLDGQVDLNLLAAEWTDEQIFRVVIVPADYVDTNARQSIDYSNYNEVIEAFDLDDTEVKRYKSNLLPG